MSRARELALLAGASLAAALGRLPVSQMPRTAPVLNYERLPDGKVRISSADGFATEAERASFARQLEAIASKRQTDVERVLAARAKRLRKAQKRIPSDG